MRNMLHLRFKLVSLEQSRKKEKDANSIALDLLLRFMLHVIFFRKKSVLELQCCTQGQLSAMVDILSRLIRQQH